MAPDDVVGNGMEFKAAQRLTYRIVGDQIHSDKFRFSVYELAITQEYQHIACAHQKRHQDCKHGG
jgi:hypothetical protein